MVERHSIMLDELNKAIKHTCDFWEQVDDARLDVLEQLRLQHGVCVRCHAYLEAWCIHGVISLIDDSPTVNDVLRELRALVAITPHSNRGVTWRIASSLGVTELDYE